MDDFAAAEAIINAAVSGRSVSRLIIDYQVRLIFDVDGDNAELIVTCPFLLTTLGAVLEADPELPPSLAPALGLLHLGLVSVSVAAPGRLTATFADGSAVAIQPDDKYEAWEFAGPAHAKVVCLPGGNVAIWRPDTATA